MKRLLKNVVLTAGVLALGLQAEAQITVAPENDPNFKLKFIGRTNLDLGTFLNYNHYDEDGVGHADNSCIVNDTRLGFVATKDKWEGKVEVCYTNGKISFRDVTIKHSFNEHNKLTFGNQFMPYGIKLTGINYKFAEDPSVDLTFCPSRKVGVNYLYTTDPFNFSAGLYSDGNVDDNKQVNQGLNITAQVIWRPVYDETTVFHLGGAFIHTDSPNAPKFSGTVPTTVSSDHRTFMSVSYDAPNYERYEFQALFIKEKFLVEAHYMGASVNVRNANSESASGVWGQVSYQIIGEGQKYNKVTSLPTASAAGTLEVLGRVDYLDLGDTGNQLDFELGLNYFINKHFNVKFNYIMAGFNDRPGVDDKTYHVVQTRLQFSF
ncbi:MAG: porin [Bacteroidales bacterium]|nr:porin [Bacteroidales bacterium]